MDNQFAEHFEPKPPVAGVTLAAGDGCSESATFFKSRRRQYRYVPYTDDVSIPIPIEATLAEEAVIVARFKLENPPDKLAVEVEEWKQILRDFEEGKLIDASVLLQQLTEYALPEVLPDHVIEP